jgi:hypothetical protein
MRSTGTSSFSIQQSLEYTTDYETGVEYLREKHNEYLPDAMLAADGAPSG